MEKTTVFNLIIIDESGSMSDVVNQTVSGCNETLNVIRTLQKEHGDSQRNLVSIYVFQSGSVPSRYLVKNKPIDDVRDITTRDYKPCGCTPLLDAVGSTLVDLRAVASTHEDSTATVTIITDGYENSSTDYTWAKVHRLISQLKELGWTFNFIGANIDVEKVSAKLNIDNSMAFHADQEGTAEMWENYNACMKSYEETRIKMELASPCMCMEDRVKMRKKNAKNFFKK